MLCCASRRTKSGLKIIETLPERGWEEKKLFDIGWLDESERQSCHKQEGTEKHRPYHCLGPEVEEDLSTLSTRYCAEVVWIGKWSVEQKEAWLNQAPEVQMWRQVKGPAKTVLCETRDLGIKWPHVFFLKENLKVN